MAESVTSLGIQMLSSRLILQGGSTMSTLSEQLATGRRSTDLTNYTATEARQILDFRSGISRRESYIEIIQTIRPRLVSYQQTLNEMSNLIAEADRILQNAQNYDQAQSVSTREQLFNILKQVEALLNTRVGDRYIYSGARYSQAPATDLTALGDPTGETYPVVSPNLPPWDKERVDSGGTTTTNPRLWDTLSSTIDDTLSINYEISTTDTGIQQMVQGLRWAYTATGSQANFSTYRTNALTLFESALDNVRTLEANAAQNVGTLDKTKILHQSQLTILKTDLDTVGGVDINEVSTKITFFQSQLEASYAVTGRIASLSIIDYLR
ncbi:MAG: hypothetical protein EBZ69_06495 [Alphaproteobacteria bacterium]|nr:hypothetical protein [Alphaproteobacteria bacterium]NDC56441.1 hypothetical protein [Alphaproteobacteria bacterium]NDG04654.1 hypothetical protein [Alphaproteobacteria bacterium]